MADEAAGGLIPLIVTDYPDADPDQRGEVTPEESRPFQDRSRSALAVSAEVMCVM
jgi:hypothetical protein